MNLSENLKKIRKDNNLSQEDFAEILKVSRQSVSKWESNQSYPEMEKILLICKKYNFTIDELINGKDKINKENKISMQAIVLNMLNWLKKLIDLFINMTFYQKVKFIIEQFIWLIIFAIIFFVIPYIFSVIYFEIVPRQIALFIIIGSALKSVIQMYLLCLIFYIYYYLLDSRYVKYIEYSDVEGEIINGNFNKETKIIKENKVTSKIIIRDSKDSSKSLFNIFSQIIIIFIKIFLFIILLFLAFILLCLMILLVLTFPLIPNMLLFTSLIFMFGGTSFGTIFSLINIYNFIFDIKVHLKSILITFIISIICIGIGMGLFLLSINGLKIKNGIHYSEEQIIEVNDINNYKFMYTNNVNNVSYNVTNDNKIVIKIKYPKYINIVTHYYNNCFEIYTYLDFLDGNYILNNFYKDLKNNEIESYENSYDIEIYANQDNINIIKKIIVK